jgi:hypothetical protein
MRGGIAPSQRQWASTKAELVAPAILFVIDVFTVSEMYKAHAVSFMDANTLTFKEFCSIADKLIRIRQLNAGDVLVRSGNHYVSVGEFNNRGSIFCKCVKEQLLLRTTLFDNHKAQIDKAIMAAPAETVEENIPSIIASLKVPALNNTDVYRYARYVLDERRTKRKSWFSSMRPQWSIRATSRGAGPSNLSRLASGCQPRRAW